MRTLLKTFHQLGPSHAIRVAAHSDLIHPLLSLQKFDYVSLYDGDSARSRAEYAPSLVDAAELEHEGAG